MESKLFLKKLSNQKNWPQKEQIDSYFANISQNDS